MPCVSIAGKKSLVRSLAVLSNTPLVEVALTAGSDTADLLGGFEQLEPRRKTQVLLCTFHQAWALSLGIHNWKRVPLLPAICAGCIISS